MSSYQDLVVWQKSIDLVESIYEVTKFLPNEEKFNLVSQMRRSAVSISSNIAEGHGRKSSSELSHFLKIAYGSGSELETQVILCRRLGFISEQQAKNDLDQIVAIHKMINKLLSRL